MKNGLILLLVGAALVVGVALWLFKSKDSASDDLLAGPKVASTSADPKKPSAHLDVQQGEQKGARTAAHSAAADAASEQPLVDPAMANTGVTSTTLGGGMPSEVSEVEDPDHFALKYKGASAGELIIAFKAVNEMYQQQTAGKTKKELRLNQDALDLMAREVTWLKEKAYGGG